MLIGTIGLLKIVKSFQRATYLSKTQYISLIDDNVSISIKEAIDFISTIGKLNKLKRRFYFYTSCQDITKIFEFW